MNNPSLELEHASSHLRQPVQFSDLISKTPLVIDFLGLYNY